MPIFSRNSKLKMLRTIIIDDEDHQRLTIETMLKSYCPDVKVVDQADGVSTGIEAIRNHHPDLVLLDIKMDDGTGFDLLDHLHPIDFKVVFITAYDQYAIKAFHYSALDYLLKPLDPDELINAVKKGKEYSQQQINVQIKNLKDILKSENSLPKKIIIKTFDNIHLIPINEILYFESDDSYVRVYLVNEENIMFSASLKHYEDMLSENGFFRVHKSYLINLTYIRRFEKAEGGNAVLDNGIKIPVASRKREIFLDVFEKLGSK